MLTAQLQPPLTPDDPAGQLLDRAIDMCAACPEYLRKEDAIRHVVLLRNLKAHRLSNPEDYGFSHSNICWWSPRMFLDTLEKFQGKVVAELPIRVLFDEGQVLEGWIMAQFGEGRHPLMPSFALDTAVFLKSQVFGRWSRGRDGHGDVLIPGMVQEKEDGKRISRGFASPAFKGAFSHRMGSLTVKARVPRDCSVQDNYHRVEVLPSGIEFLFGFSRCHLSSTSEGVFSRPVYFKVRDPDEARFDLGSDFSFDGTVLFVGEIYRQIHLFAGHKIAPEKLRSDLIVHPRDWGKHREIGGIRMHLPARWITHVLDLRREWGDIPPPALPVPDWEAALENPSLLPAPPLKNRSRITTDEAERFVRGEQVELEYSYEIDDAAAVVLAKHEGPLQLDAVCYLSDNAAEALSAHKAELSLPGLTKISPKAAAALKRHGRLSCPDLDELAAVRLTPYEVQRFLAGENLELQQFTKIQDAAAELLANCEGDLRLNGLTALSAKAAAVLAKRKGHLDLNGLSELSIEVATALASLKGCLSLNGLKCLTNEAADVLAKHEGVLILDGLISLTDDTADALARHRGNLYLNGVASLSVNAMGLLARKGSLPELRGLLRSLPEEAARILGQHRAGDLWLNGLTSITDRVAEALCCKGGWYLELNGLTTISAKAAESVSNKWVRVFMNGLVSLQDEAAAALGNLHGDQLSLDGLAFLSDRAAEFLSKRRGNLSLKGLKSLSPHAAAMLKKQGSLNPAFLDELAGEKILTVKIAESFIAGRLPTVDKFTLLEDGAAEVLVRHKGDLKLSGLTALSDKAAETLAQFRKGDLYLDGLKNLSAKAAAALEQNPRLRAPTSDRLAIAKVLTAEMAKRLGREEEPGLEYFTALEDDAADELATWKRSLKLKALSSVSRKAAQSLANHREPLFLDGLATMSDEVVEALAKHEGWLSLDAVQVLSNRAVEALALHKGSLCLCGLTSLSLEHAQILARHEDDLWIRVPPSLPSKTAEALATIRGDLWLYGLPTLSDGVADALATHKGLLSLAHVKWLSDYAAEALAKHEGTLYLSHIESLSQRGLAALKKHPNLIPQDLEKRLADAKVLTLAAVEHFLSGYPLDLRDFTSIADPAAKRLSRLIAREQVGALVLDGLTSLTEESAGALARYEAMLSLNGLKSISDKVLGQLAWHEGGLSLDGVSSISDEIAVAFGCNDGDLSFNGLTCVSAHTCHYLAKRKGKLRLNGLTSISDKAAAALATHQGTLHLNGLLSISHDAAEALAKHAGDLSLNGLVSLSPESAAGLANHDGSLCLGGLTTLSEEAAKSLQKHQGELLLLGLTCLSKEAAAALGKHWLLWAPDLDKLVARHDIGQRAAA